MHLFTQTHLNPVLALHHGDYCVCMYACVCVVLIGKFGFCRQAGFAIYTITDYYMCVAVVD